jgi:DNA (cytosine-5)-methyltransferase 1
MWKTHEGNAKIGRWPSLNFSIFVLSYYNTMKKCGDDHTAGTLVSLYAGAGGMDIGFSQAGFVPIWSNEIDRNAHATYQKWFPDHLATLGDITTQLLPIGEKVDLVIGGPPCQGFSVAGKMNPNDPRSRHVWNFLDVVTQLNPRGFVMENVKALAENQKWQPLMGALRQRYLAMGFQTKLIVLNAAHFGVPQARERMFLIGLREGGFEPPKPTTLHQPLTVRQALSELPQYGKPGNHQCCTAKVTLAKQPILRKSPYAGMLFNGQGRPINLDGPALTLPASMGGNRTPIIDQRSLDEGSEPWIASYHRALSEGQSFDATVPDYLRRLTVEEAAILQTFPKEMAFCGMQSSKFRQIGNAVPPTLAYHVALAVRAALEGSKKAIDQPLTAIAG